MEAVGGTGFSSMNVIVKKPRSNTLRRPRPDSHAFFEAPEISPSSRTPPSDNASKSSSDDNVGQSSSFSRKEFNLNDPATSRFIFSKTGGETLPKKSRKDESNYGEIGGYYSGGSSKGNTLDYKRSSEGVLAPANWKSSNKVNYDSGGFSNGSKEEALSHDKKLKKVTLKLKGVTHTIQASSKYDSALGGLSAKTSRPSDGPRPRQKLIIQDNSDDEPSLFDQGNGLQHASWKDLGESGVGLKENPKGKISEQSGSLRQTEKSFEPVRKSKRVPKRRVLDGAFDEGDEDEELRYLGRLKTARVSYDHGIKNGDEEEDDKKRKLSEISKIKMDYGDHDDVEDYGSSRKSKEGRKKLRPERDLEDTDYVEEDEEDDDVGSDDGHDPKRKKPKKESLDALADGRKGIALTTRQRALQSGKDASSGTGSSLIEFPDGLPPAPPRKQKEKLSEVDQQLKKAEAAQRRRMQVEKANRESEAEAIRKILGQDSNRKKKEDKERKRRDERAQEKAANAATLAANTVRWVMGPTGTVVTFPTEMGLPSIFNSKPCSYPPPREKCAGPSCTNPYKYRDSKSNLPLCSLQCYKAVNQGTKSVTTC